MYLFRQNYTIISQNWKNQIPPNAKSWNGLKRSIAGNLKKNYFRGYADHAYALLRYHQSQGRLRS